MTTIDEPKSESTEQAEATALAEALDRDVALPDLPADALEAAAFLRFNAKDAELGADAEQRIFAELDATLQRAPSSKPARRGFKRVWIWFTPTLALGALLFMMQAQHRAEPASVAPRATTVALSSPLPSPQEQLILDQTALCDLAETQLTQGQPESALRTIADGLVLSAASSTALARLYELKAQAHERRGETILANDSYFQALQINRQLMQRSLGE